MAEYEKYLEAYSPELPMSQALIDMAKEILQLRRMLWFSHGHTGVYGDDGEMQCSECMTEYGFWDWRRTDIEKIRSKFEEGNLKKILDSGIII